MNFDFVLYCRWLHSLVSVGVLLLLSLLNGFWVFLFLFVGFVVVVGFFLVFFCDFVVVVVVIVVVVLLFGVF